MILIRLCNILPVNSHCIVQICPPALGRHQYSNLDSKAFLQVPLFCSEYIRRGNVERFASCYNLFLFLFQLGLLTGAIRLLKSQRAKPDPILCMSLLYLTKIRPNMFAHETVTNILCTLLKREQGAAFKNKGNPLVFVLACNMLYAGHRENNNWPDIFIKVSNLCAVVYPV